MGPQPIQFNYDTASLLAKPSVMMENILATNISKNHRDYSLSIGEIHELGSKIDASSIQHALVIAKHYHM